MQTKCENGDARVFVIEERPREGLFLKCRLHLGRPCHARVLSARCCFKCSKVLLPVQCFCWWKLVVQWREKQRLMEIGAWFDACLTLAAVSCLQSVPAHANALSIGVDGDGRAAAAGNGGYF